MTTTPADRLKETTGLDTIAEPLDRLSRRVLPDGPMRDALEGKWLGHPVHPALTDLPIGFWTCANVLDLVGGKGARPAAQKLVALGVLSVVPTAVSGWADYGHLEHDERRVGVVHAASNVVATVFYAKSWLARRAGHHGKGVLLGLAGMTVATVGGYLGGHLAFGAATDAEAEPVGESTSPATASPTDAPVVAA